MSKAPITVKSKSSSLVKSMEEIDFEEKRMQDVLLLLEDLAQREETTVKKVLECLYDIGSVNLINKKMPVGPLNPLLKILVRTRFSKFLFVKLAWRWFAKNCPRLIANWLYRKVSF